MQPSSSRIWTRVAVSISFDDNHNTTGNTFGKDINLTALFRAKRRLAFLILIKRIIEEKENTEFNQSVFCLNIDLVLHTAFATESAEPAQIKRSSGLLLYKDSNSHNTRIIK